MNNIPISKVPQEYEDMVKKWKDDKKPSRIAGSFNTIEELQPIHLNHFKTAIYLWKPLQGNIWGGMLMDDSLEYIHLVLVSPKVLEFILNKCK